MRDLHIFSSISALSVSKVMMTVTKMAHKTKEHEMLDERNKKRVDLKASEKKMHR